MDIQTRGGGGDMTYKYLSATGQSAGSLNLTDTHWDTSKAQISYISVIVASGTVNDFDIAVYEKDTFLSADLRYSSNGLNSSDNWRDNLIWIYTDKDGTNEIHLKITENSGTGTYDIHVRGVKLV